MAEDRAHDSARQPKILSYSNVRLAHTEGKITRDEAIDLLPTKNPEVKYSGHFVNRWLPEGEQARNIHKNAGLTEGNW